MPDIRQLPPSVVNKIAAGEVIERPASVVKELLENSVDAGARRIDVSLAQGGSDLIRVVDDGCGIAPEQLALAVASHATSKIQDADDLFRVGTLGFRGEALASIAEISQLCLKSRTPGSECGVELEVIGGVASQAVPCGSPTGTTVEVRNLFYNTPVRRKFMRTTQTEMGHASEAFTRIALAFPALHFTLRHNERIVYELPAADWRERIAAFFGADLAAGLIPVASSDGDVKLSGYVADPNFSRGNNRMQYLFLNGRHIRDRALQHALGEAYRGLLLTGRFPIAFLRLDMPADAVDVNVHPTKLEVRFQESGRIYSQLLGALRKKFLATDLTARVGHAASPSEAASAHDSAEADRHRRELVDWAKGQLPAPAAMFPPASEPADLEQANLDLQFDTGRRAPLELNRIDRSWSTVGGTQREPEQGGGVAVAEPPMPYSGDASVGNALRGVPSLTSNSERHGGRSLQETPHHASAAAPRAMQVHNRYLITEDEHGMVVIDQHALHERILYEELREKVLSGAMETQRLLVPEPVHLTPAEAAAALQAHDLLAQLGIEVEPFGGDTVLVSGYPAMLANLGPAEIFRQMVEQLMSGGKTPDRRDVLDELLHMISCKAAIKAGDRLSADEITALVARRELCQDAHHCPHGRPTALVFTREELDRRFKRT